MEKMSTMNGFSELTLDEMMGVDGGAVNGFALVGGATLMAIGKNARTPYTRTVVRQGRKSTVSYTPTKGTRNFGNACYIIGSSLIGYALPPKIGLGAGIGLSTVTSSWE